MRRVRDSEREEVLEGCYRRCVHARERFERWEGWSGHLCVRLRNGVTLSGWKAGVAEGEDAAVSLFQTRTPSMIRRLPVVGRRKCGAPVRHATQSRSETPMDASSCGMPVPLFEWRSHEQSPLCTDVVLRNNQPKAKDANNPINHLRVPPSFNGPILCRILYRHARPLSGARLRPRKSDNRYLQSLKFKSLRNTHSSGGMDERTCTGVGA